MTVKQTMTKANSKSRRSNLCEYFMRYTHSCLILFTLPLALGATGSWNAVGEEIVGSQTDLEPLGAAALKLDGDEMARWIEVEDLDSSSPGLHGDVVVATWAVASAQNQPDVLKIAQSLAASDAALRTRTESLRDAFKNLRAQRIEIDPGHVLPDMIVITKEARRTMLVAALRGDTESVRAAQAFLAEEDLAEALKKELSLFASGCRELSVQMKDSALAEAIDQAAHARQKRESLQRSQLQWLADFRTDPDGAEVPRGGEANSYTVMVEKEKARAALITAYTQLYTAYVNGQKTRVECIKGMQEVSSGALDLKEKRATMYWTLKKLRSEHLKERREKSVAFSQKRSQEQRERSASDFSATWPTVFQHRDLREHADSLLANLADYSPGNSGPLSVAYTRCAMDIRALNKRLMSDLDGITLAQRAALRSYLRKLEVEIKREYSSSGYIASLNTPHRLDTRSLAAKSPPSAARSSDFGPAVLTLDGDDTDVASYALYRSILISLVKAGKKGDKERLRALASVIQETDLLKKEHKQSLNAIGSKLYSGTLNLDRAIFVEDPESVLATIAGLSGDETGALLEVPDGYREKAFEILIATAFDDSGV